MLKRHILISAIWIAVLGFWTSPAFAQESLWSRTYGGSNNDGIWYGCSGQQTRDGGYIVVGETNSFGAGNYDAHLIKTNASGDTLWTRTYGGGSFDGAYSVQQTTDRGYIVAGYTSSFGAGNNDFYLIKTDSLGNTLWSRTYGGSDIEIARSVQQTTDGGYIVAGETWSFAAGYDDVYLVKTDSLGDTLWTRTYGGSNYDYGYSVQQTTDGGYIVAGWTWSFGAGAWDFYLIKTNSTGDTLWSRSYGGSREDRGYSVQQTTDGGYIVAGYAFSFDAGDADVYLIKTNSLGDTLWSRTYGGSSIDLGYSVHQTTDGGYIVAGRTESFGAGNWDVYLLKTDSLGDILWSRSYGGSNREFGYSVQQTADGGYIVTGGTESFGAGLYDFMLTKLDCLGNTCIGEFVTSTVMSVSPTVTSPAWVVTSPATVVTSPTDTVTSPATEVTTVCVAVSPRGDANGDGLINIADVVYLVTYLFLYGPAPDPLWLGDANCDGVVNIADAVYLVTYLFLGGPPPGCP